MGLNAKELETARNEYAMVCRIEGKSSSTIDHYQSVIKLFIRSLGPRELTPGTIRSFLAGLSDDHKITTVSSYCRALRAFCHFLLREDLIEEDPMKDIRTPKVPRKFPHILSEEEVTELLSVAKRNPRDYAILLLLLDTGVRASELITLYIDDVDISAMSARVFGKGGKSRTVFFSPVTAKALARWKAKRPDIPHERAFFLSQRGGELTVSGLRLMLKRLQARSAIKDKKVCPHVIRHCFASLYAKEGGDPHSLAALMGHTSTKMAEVYVHMAGRDLARSHRRWSPVTTLRNEGRC